MIFKSFHCPSVGDKYKIAVKDKLKWTVVISVCKNDGVDYHCYECDTLLSPGNLQGRKGGFHFCIACVSAHRLQEGPIVKAFLTSGASSRVRD